MAALGRTLRARPGRGAWGALPFLGVAVPGRHSWRVWQRNRDVFFQLWRVNLVPPIIEPVVMILAMGLGLGAFVELSGDREYIVFLAPGVLAVFPMFAGMGETLWGAFWRMEQQGTYAAILATPARPEDIITGDLLWAATRTLISAVSILIVLALFTPAYGLIQSPLAIFVLPTSILMGLLFGNLGLAYTSYITSIHQLMYFFTLVITPMFWFSGVFFPLDSLPGWVQVLAWFIPMSHVVDLFRGLVSGDMAWAHLGDLAWLLVVTALTFWLALWTMRRRLVQ